MAAVVGQVSDLQTEVALLRVDSRDVRDQLAAKSLENDALHAQNQQLRDEIARIKNLPAAPVANGEGDCGNPQAPPAANGADRCSCSHQCVGERHTRPMGNQCRCAIRAVSALLE